MPPIGQTLLELVDDSQRRWLVRIETPDRSRIDIRRDDQPLAAISGADLHFILREHDDDDSAAQALCSRLALELAGQLPAELKTAVFAGLSMWIRRNRRALEAGSNLYNLATP